MLLSNVINQHSGWYKDGAAMKKLSMDTGCDIRVADNASV